ncbi:MAG: hypothetical protein HY390_00050 [Deltaproteobacteria bacterium]|nr:hypothetical protein [Deltaproteobacteria bacterium]
MKTNNELAKHAFSGWGKRVLEGIVDLSQNLRYQELMSGRDALQSLMDELKNNVPEMDDDSGE